MALGRRWTPGRPERRVLFHKSHILLLTNRLWILTRASTWKATLQILDINYRPIVVPLENVGTFIRCPRIVLCVKRGGIVHYACHDITERHRATWRHRRIGLSPEAILLWHQCIMQWKVQRRLTPPSPTWTAYEPVLWVKSTWLKRGLWFPLLRNRRFVKTTTVSGQAWCRSFDMG